MRSASWGSWRSSFPTPPTGLRTATSTRRSSPSSRWRIPCTSYLLRSGGETVLVDTGVGPAGLWGWDAEFEEGLLPALAAAGAAPRTWTSSSSRTSTSITSAGTPTGTASSSFRTRATSRIATGSPSPATAAGRTSSGRSSVEFEEIDGEAVVAEGVTALSAAWALPRAHGPPDRIGGRARSSDRGRCGQSDVADQPDRATSPTATRPPAPQRAGRCCRSSSTRTSSPSAATIRPAASAVS